MLSFPKQMFGMVGSILTGGGSGKKEREPLPCKTCERLKKGNNADNGGRSASSSPPIRRLFNVGNGQDDGVGGDADVEEDGGESRRAPCGHKHVNFAPVVSAVYVPVHSEYR